ncbi:MAG: 5-(carboxyamino)imidazole ribonucleotide synthase [Woeseiaceae bacterium]|nr:5-(carboxyamino)imidazole ribonucleotide synthase [Woeseiaceae bacterium]NIP21601.1 5-(carboxyamino)imidazole ribonucleotide synthase [Woeseiaceae bacterium]NIS90575.1 5-(carboxyamino)imidazole ribonucleotide synthase [Woeseiaceae bacterium]
MRIGIIGAGQLGQMLGFAARELGHECFYLDPSEAPPAARVGPVVQAAFDDRVALSILAEKCDVLTYEFENVPVEALDDIGDTIPISPPLDALRLAQDRLTEKQLFERLDIPLPGYHVVDSEGDLRAAADSIGLPLVVKTRRMGYDGKGQFVIRTEDQIATAWRDLGGQPLIAEQWVEFDYEVSAIGVRGRDGEVATYCLTHNEHAEGILRTSRAPVDEPELTAKGTRYLARMLEDLDYVGVLALELFVVGENLLANEFAPRVHNSGHWTIEGAQTSQFANHILAVTGGDLGATANIGHAGMINLIGEIPDAVRRLDEGVLHDYGKSARPGRKLGHITFVAESAADRDARIAAIRRSVS